MAVNGVAHTLEIDGAFDHHRPILFECPLAHNENAVILGGLNLGYEKLLAVWCGHEIRAIAKISGHDVAARLVCGIHQNIAGLVGVFALRRANSGNRVVKIRKRNFLVHLCSSVDKNGISLKSSNAKHRHEERSLVAADAIAIVERDIHIMRRITRGSLLHGKAHVAHFLRNPLVDRADLGDIVGILSERRDDVCHTVRDGRRRLGKMRKGKIPIPFGKLLPATHGGNLHILHLLIHRRHIRLLKSLRRILGRPSMHHGAIALLLGCILHIPERIANGHILERSILGRFDRHRIRENRTLPFKNADIGKMILDARHKRLALCLVCDDIANLESGNRADDLAIHRIVDVGGNGGIVCCLLSGLGNIYLANGAIQAFHKNLNNLGAPVAGVETKGNHTLLAASLLRQNLNFAQAFRLVCAIGLILRIFALINKNGIGIRILRDIHLLVCGLKCQRKKCCSYSYHHFGEIAAHCQFLLLNYLL